jgi:hypothetical protein
MSALALLSGAAPAFRGARVNLRDSLETGGTRVVGGGQRLRGAFIIGRRFRRWPPFETSRQQFPR